MAPHRPAGLAGQHLSFRAGVAPRACISIGGSGTTGSSLSGEMFVALVDLRTGSPTERADLDAATVGGDAAGLFIPPGVAHGFLAETDLVLGYLVDRYFDGTDEWGVAWNDPALGIDWPAADPDPVRAGSEQPRAWRRRCGTRSRTRPDVG